MSDLLTQGHLATALGMSRRQLLRYLSQLQIQARGMVDGQVAYPPETVATIQAAQLQARIRRSDAVRSSSRGRKDGEPTIMTVAEAKRRAKAGQKGGVL